MIKQIPPGSYDFGEPQSVLVKKSSQGLKGRDLDEFLKRASYRFAQEVRAHNAPGEELIHLIAMGSTEKYGCNRNGDGFRGSVLNNDHPSFVKRAMFFRDHKNRDPAKSYGRVVASCYNDPLGRVELLVGLNATKEAADRNGGLVADTELEKLAAEEPIPVSMSTRVPHDVCTGCGNKAKNRAEYCDENSCVKYGGLKRNLGRVFADGHHLHADNPINHFFDISHVWRPADRIAWVLGRAKQAHADNLVIGGAELAEESGLSTPWWLKVDDPELADRIKIAHQLAEVERTLDGSPPQLSWLVDDLPEDLTEHLCKLAESPLTRGSVWGALAGARIILSPYSWLQIHGRTKSAAAANAIANRLPGIYGRMVDNTDHLETMLQDHGFESAPAPSNLARQMDKAASCSIGTRGHRESVSRRAVARAASGSPEVTCRHDDGPALSEHQKVADAIATRYAVYKIAALQEISRHLQTLSPEVAKAAIRPHYVI